MMNVLALTWVIATHGLEYVLVPYSWSHFFGWPYWTLVIAACVKDTFQLYSMGMRPTLKGFALNIVLYYPAYWWGMPHHA
jgi:hypothetical protein